jgi:hypothetical protein
MKRVTLSASLLAKLQSAAGADVDVSQFPVYEAIALNTQAVRKEHPLYKGGRHTTNYLQQMAQAVNAESLPLQLMHDDAQLPAGRIFYGEVVGSNELRVLFWVDPQQTALIDSLDNGTIDQVSVSTLAETAACSACGWNFLGSESSLDNIWSGTCANGHVVGDGGTHVVMNNLGTWFEMSLVGRGGATGARIVSPSSSKLTTDYRLAASGKAVPWVTLSLSNTELEPKMDPELKALLESLQTSLAALKPTAEEPSVADLLAQLNALKSELADLKKPPTESGTPANPVLLAGFAEIAKQILIMSGDVEAVLPEDSQAAVDLVKGKLSALKPTAPPTTQEAATGSTQEAQPRKRTSAFKAAAR